MQTWPTLHFQHQIFSTGKVFGPAAKQYGVQVKGGIRCWQSQDPFNVSAQSKVHCIEQIGQFDTLTKQLVPLMDRK